MTITYLYYLYSSLIDIFASGVNMFCRYFNCNPHYPYYSEVLCIGAGVSNAYVCYQLSKKNIYTGKITVLEKSECEGGRILSKRVETSTREFGAMRLFDVPQMKKVFNLLKELGIKTINVSTEEQDNVFYYCGKRYLKKEATLSSGIKVSEFEDYVVSQIKNAYPEIDLNNIFEYEEFRNMNITQLFLKYGNATQDDIKMWISYSGYDLNLEDTQITKLLHEKGFYFGKENQYYVVDGMATLVRKLFEHSNTEIIYNTKAISVEKDAEGCNIITTINSKSELIKYKCKYLFIGITSGQLQGLNTVKIPIPISQERLQSICSVISLPLFKVFFKWDKENVWWGKDKHKTGKSTTDLPIRQVFYYNDEDILVYNSGKYATELYCKFLESPEKASMEVYRQIAEMHQIQIPPPNFAYTTFKYWVEGSSRWLVGTDIQKNIEIISNGIVDNSNIFIVGDNYSKCQGWIVGAMDSADLALNSLMEKQML